MEIILVPVRSRSTKNLCVCGYHFQQAGHQQGTVANPTCGRLNRAKNSPCPRSRLRYRPRKLGSVVPSHISPVIFQTYT